MNEKREEKDLFLTILGKHIRRKRKQRQLTLEELAEEINGNDKHLGRLERGEKEASSYTLALIQIALDLNSDDYLNEFLTAKQQWEQKN